MKLDSELVFDFLGKITVIETIAEFEQEAVPFLQSVFAAQSVLAVHFHRDSKPEAFFRWIPDAHLRKTFDENYVGLGYLLDPFYQQSWIEPNWSAFALREIAPDKFESSDYFSSYFGNTQMVDDLGLIVRISENSSIHLSIGRSLNKRKYSKKDIFKFRQLAKVLAPKLRQIVQKNQPLPTEDALSLEQRFFDVSKSLGAGVSKREAEVAAMIVKGHSSIAIASIFALSVHTVKVHRRSLYKKLQITSQSELFGLLTKAEKLVKV